MRIEDEGPNLAARLAVLIGRGSRVGAIARPSIFAFLILCWFALTGIGAWQESPEAGFGARVADVLYDPFTFLAPQDSYFNRAQSDLLHNPFLWLGRFFGAAIPVYAIIWTAIAWGRQRIAHNLLSIATGHVVIYSQDGAADAMAIALARTGEVVVLAESEPRPERQQALIEAGVILLDDLRPGSLRHTGAERASRVIAWGSDDANNLGAALDIGAQLHTRHEDLLVRVESPELRRALRKAPDLLEREDSRIRPISLNQTAVREAFANSDLVEAALANGQDRVHVALLGHSSLLEDICSFALRQNWSALLATPKVSIASDDLEAWQEWLTLHRTAFSHFRVATEADIDPVATGSPIGSLLADGSVTRFIVDMGDDDATVRTCFRLATEIQQFAESPALVQPVVRSIPALRNLYEGSRMPFAAPVILSLESQARSLVSRERDEAAARKHLVYLHGLSDDATPLPANKDWRDISETFVHANRAAADHEAVKQFDLAELAARGSQHEDALLRAAMSEHRRWCAERLLDGWRPGPRTEETRDRQLHDKLVPWSQLNDEDKRKDADQVRAAWATPARDHPVLPNDDGF